MKTLFYRQKWIMREDLQAHPNMLFLFGDNTLRKGYKGQAKEMRGEPNAYGIVTKWTPKAEKDAYFSDNDLVEACRLIAQDFRPVFAKRNKVPMIIIPADGLGTGLSKLPEKAPKVNEFLEWMIEMLIDGRQPAWKQILNEGGHR